MKRFGMSFAVVAMFAAFVLGTAGVADAQRRNDREVRDVLRSLTSKIDELDYNLNYQLKSNSANRDNVAEVSDDIRDLKSSVRDFQKNFDQKRENRDDVNRVIDAARRIDEFLNTYPQNRQITDNWNGTRSQIDRLGSNYGISTNWNNEEGPQSVKDYPPYPQPVQNNTISVGLSGTYQLDLAKSDSIDDAIGNVNLGNDQRADLKDKLEAPGQIAIDIRGNQVILATSNASPVTFTADGREKVEQGANGKSLTLRATLNGQALNVASRGNGTDYTITFNSADNGQILKVTRRITTDYLDQTVFAESLYNKTDAVAGLGINTGGSIGNNNDNSGNNGGYSDNDQNGNATNGSNPPYGGTPRTVPGRTGDYVVPNGTIISGILENEINTKASQNNDRFRLTVQSPNEFRGAVVEGYISGVARSGKVTGRSNVTFNFDKITLKDGKTYDFAGNLQSITDQTGKVVKVDAEGTAKGGSQTRQTATRGGIGAGIGAVIGAIAGGGTGAAVGAIIGGAAGAGSVAIQGRSDIQLQKGSTMTLQSSSPIARNKSQDN